MTWFEDLLVASEDDSLLRQRFAALFDYLCAVDVWDGQAEQARRIPWRLGEHAREVFDELFSTSGIYLWGVDNCPLYVGLAKEQSFAGRFGRYIWQERSQCKLAQRHEANLKVNGMAGFPRDVLDWYAKAPSYYKSRLRGAVRFTEEGIDRIWFSLLSHSVPADIRRLEKALISAANCVTTDRGFPPLVNKQDAQRMRRRGAKQRGAARTIACGPVVLSLPKPVA